MDQLKELGRRLKELRRDRGFSQVHLAAVSGVSIPTIISIESGMSFRISSLFRIVECMGVSVADLVDDSSHPDRRHQRDLIKKIRRLDADQLKHLDIFIKYLDVKKSRAELDATINELHDKIYSPLSWRIQDVRVRKGV